MKKNAKVLTMGDLLGHALVREGEVDAMGSLLVEARRLAFDYRKKMVKAEKSRGRINSAYTSLSNAYNKQSEEMVKLREYNEAIQKSLSLATDELAKSQSQGGRESIETGTLKRDLLEAYGALDKALDGGSDDSLFAGKLLKADPRNPMAKSHWFCRYCGTSSEFALRLRSHRDFCVIRKAYAALEKERLLEARSGQGEDVAR